MVQQFRVGKIRLKYYTYVEPKAPPDDMEAVYVTLSEQEIIEQYYPYWSSRMIQKFGKEHFEATYSEKECIEDFCVIHWAWEVEDGKDQD